MIGGSFLVRQSFETQPRPAEPVHWGHKDARPTSLHGNGAASFARTTLDESKVTCAPCKSLLSESPSSPE